MIVLIACAPIALVLIVAIVSLRRKARRRVERFAEDAGLRRLPGESNASLQERAVRRYNAGLTLTYRGRG